MVSVEFRKWVCSKLTIIMKQLQKRFGLLNPCSFGKRPAETPVFHLQKARIRANCYRLVKGLIFFCTKVTMLQFHNCSGLAGFYGSSVHILQNDLFWVWEQICDFVLGFNTWIARFIRYDTLRWATGILARLLEEKSEILLFCFRALYISGRTACSV